MAEGANCAEDCASRRMLRRGDFNGALCLCSPSLPALLSCKTTRPPWNCRTTRLARVRWKVMRTGVATRRQLGGLDDGGQAGRPQGRHLPIPIEPPNHHYEARLGRTVRGDQNAAASPIAGSGRLREIRG
jgi:hypothetical protein